MIVFELQFQFMKLPTKFVRCSSNPIIIHNNGIVQHLINRIRSFSHSEAANLSETPSIFSFT